MRGGRRIARALGLAQPVEEPRLDHVGGEGEGAPVAGALLAAQGRPADHCIGLARIALMGEAHRLGVRRGRLWRTGICGGLGPAGQCRDRPPHRLDRGVERDVADDDRMHRPAGEQGRIEAAELFDRRRLDVAALDRPPAQIIGADDAAQLASRAGRGRGELQIIAIDRAGLETGEQIGVPARMRELGGEQAKLVGKIAAAGLAGEHESVFLDPEGEADAPPGEQPLHAVEIEPGDARRRDQRAHPAERGPVRRQPRQTAAEAQLDMDGAALELGMLEGQARTVGEADDGDVEILDALAGDFAAGPARARADRRSSPAARRRGSRARRRGPRRSLRRAPVGRREALRAR